MKKRHALYILRDFPCTSLPQQPLGQIDLNSLISSNISINPSTKMTYPALSMWDGPSKSTWQFVYLLEAKNNIQTYQNIFIYWFTLSNFDLDAKVIYPKYSKHWDFNVWYNKNQTKLIRVLLLWLVQFLMHQTLLWHTQLIVCAENVKLWFKSSLYPAPYIELYVC